MGRTYNQVYIQTVFAVKYRKGVLLKPWRYSVFRTMSDIINEKDCKCFIVNGVEDHVHCFFSLKPSVSISGLMKAVKARSSKYINDHRLTPVRFEWQRGFGAFSYSQDAISNVYHYIKRQEQHHRKKSFRTEYIQLLDEFDIAYDESNLFDFFLSAE